MFSIILGSIQLILVVAIVATVIAAVRNDNVSRTHQFYLNICCSLAVVVFVCSIASGLTLVFGW